MEQEPEQDRAVNTKVHYLDFSQKENFTSSKKLEEASENSALTTVKKEIFTLKPSIPVYFIRPAAIKRAAQFFLQNFQFLNLYSNSNFFSSSLFYFMSLIRLANI